MNGRTKQAGRGSQTSQAGASQGGARPPDAWQFRAGRAETGPAAPADGVCPSQGEVSTTAAPRAATSKPIAAVISDVDGTLLTHDKQLTVAARDAARRLSAVGVRFTLASSRPPRGMRHMLTSLAINVPAAAFNGGAIVRPDLSLIQEQHLPGRIVSHVLDACAARGIDVWLFAVNEWWLSNPAAAHVELEKRTLGFEPRIVERLDRIERVAKIIATTADHPGLATAERELQQDLGEQASVARSQPYYLDITPSSANKGYAVRCLAELLGVDLSQVAVLGDMSNDLPMFAQAGLAIAMGQASIEVRERAHYVTESNEADGFAVAIERFVLPRVDGRRPVISLDV